MKPLEVVGVLVGLAGLGVGAWALWNQTHKPDTKKAEPGTTAVLQVKPVAPGAAAPGQGANGLPFGDPMATIQGVTNLATGVVGTINQLGSLFGQLNFGF